MAFSKRDRERGVTSAELISCAPGPEKKQKIKTAINDLLDAFAKEFETQDHEDVSDDENLIILDENQEVQAVCLYLTYGHFRRLRAALQRKGNRDG